MATLPLPHALDRIEAMGSGAVVVGSNGRDLYFSGVRLGRSAMLADRYTRPNALQGETRTHGFFYRPGGGDAGVPGLPVSGGGRLGYGQLDPGSASVLFLRNQAFQLRELGELAAGDPAAGDDACRVSCVDWYGNARPSSCAAASSRCWATSWWRAGKTTAASASCAASASRPRPRWRCGREEGGEIFRKGSR